MGNFIQLHLLTNYGPSNLNRDDLGRPKTVVIGGVQRLRISSQSLKRACRTSDLFEELSCGIRTKEMGVKIKDAFTTDCSLEEILLDKIKTPSKTSGIAEKEAKAWAWKIASVFVDKMKKGKPDTTEDDENSDKENKKDKKKEKSNVDKDTLKGEQIVFYYPEEIAKMSALITKLKGGEQAPSDKEINDLLVDRGSGIDVSMFGRMMACSPAYNVEAAVQVAHAFTVHKAAVEDDYFTAVDDLNVKEEHSGSAHIGAAEFGAGVFYLYICIDRNLLRENLSGDKELTNKAIGAFIGSVVTVSPSGKQNSFASRSYASYILAEKGEVQPRSLSVAFLKPISSDDIFVSAIEAIENTKSAFDKVYNENDIQSKVVNILKPEAGTLKELIEFCKE